MKIGVIGAGTMGRGIAQVAATNGHEVILTDISNDTLNEARDFIQRMLNRSAEKGRLSDAEAKAIFGKIYFGNSFSAYVDCGLVIEAVVEKIDVKHQIFKSVEEIVSSDCILASNTSSLSITSIASACKNPARVIGIHFFNPAPLMKLVEIIPAIQTSETIVETSINLISSWDKVTALAKDTPGFIVNRVARPFYSEAIRILEEGMADVPTIDAALTEEAGFRMGPFTLMDFIGNDINYAVTESVFAAFYYDPKYKPALTQKRLVEANWLGRKSMKGYYSYEKRNGKIEKVSNNSTITKSTDIKLKKKIVDRIIYMLINEAADAVFWQIGTAEDIDSAMTKGVNYPKGLLAWADELSIENCVYKMDELYNFYHEDRYRCSPLLRKMAKSGKNFYSNILNK